MSMMKEPCELLAEMFEPFSSKAITIRFEKPIMQKVIFNEPATIVIWDDGTKTVVKCGERDVYDPEKGLALCFMKKMLGNTGRYYETVKKALAEYEKTQKGDADGKETSTKVPADAEKSPWVF